MINKYGITNLTGSPTAYRLLIAGGEAFARSIKGKLRIVSSAGEPLNPEVIRWFADNLDVVIHDHYGQTELGMVLCNHHGLEHPIHMGAAGFASPGHRIVVLDDDYRELGVGQPGFSPSTVPSRRCAGSLATKARRPSAFVGNYYLSGDTVEWNPDGSISFVGRSDDVITTSGYRVGPFDVESALIEHPAVVEAAVVGKPDPERTELVKAFVVICSQYTRHPGAGRRVAPIRAQAPGGALVSPRNRICQRVAENPAGKCSALSCATRKSPRLKRPPRRTFQLESRRNNHADRKQGFSRHWRCFRPWCGHR